MFRGVKRICPECSEKFLFEPSENEAMPPVQLMPPQSDAAATKKPKFQKLTAKCPQCTHEFKVEASYLGINRACPSCSHKFLFDTPMESDDLVAQLRRGGERMSCLECFRHFKPQGAFAEAARVCCSTCGSLMDRDDGIALFKMISVGEKQASEMLLAGNAHAEVLRQLQDLGMRTDAANAVFEQQLNELPFTRFENARSGDASAGEYVWSCDICCKDLMPREHNRAHMLTWSITQTTGEEEVSAWSMATVLAVGVVVTKDKLEKSFKQGVYMMCEDCLGQRQFDFPVGCFVIGREHDIVVGAVDRGCGFGEDDGKFGHFRVLFFDVIFIVLADAQQFTGPRHRRPEPHVVGFHRGQVGESAGGIFGGEIGAAAFGPKAPVNFADNRGKVAYRVVV